jgi:hypothetical protein
MTALHCLRGEPPHDRQRIHDEALCWRVILHELEEFEGQLVLVAMHLRDVSAPLQADQHAEDLRHGAIEFTRDLALCQSSWLVSQQFDNVEALLQRRSRVRDLVLGFLLALHWSTDYSRRLGEGPVQVRVAAVDHDLLPRRVRGLRGR